MAKTKTELREWISSGFTRVEDVAYVSLGLVLAVAALVLLVIVALSLGQAIMSANLPDKVVRLLDQSLLILMIVEILYTLQVSFREHTLVAEPFSHRRPHRCHSPRSHPNRRVLKTCRDRCSSIPQRDVRAGSFDGLNPRPSILSFPAEAPTHRLRRSRMRAAYTARAESKNCVAISTAKRSAVTQRLRCPLSS